MADRSKVTFSQAEGMEDLPGPLALGVLPERARNQIWRVLHDVLQGSMKRGSMVSWLGDPMWTVYKDTLVDFANARPDEVKSTRDEVFDIVKSIVFRGKFNQVFDFLTILMRHRSWRGDNTNAIAAVFEREHLAYRVVREGPSIIPVATPEEGQAIQKALRDLAGGALGGARTHLLKAAEALNDGRWADSVRESIHSVESVVCTLSGEKGTLGATLKTLKGKQYIHPALEQAFDKMYGYTNDEGGIRHALLEDEAKVDQTDAVFMLGACASFCTYLVAKSRA